jgi:hypothetical protein
MISEVDVKVQQQTALPPAHVNTVLEAMHNDMGHPGKDRTLSLLKDRFYWPGMSKEVVRNYQDILLSSFRWFQG